MKRSKSWRFSASRLALPALVACISPLAFVSVAAAEDGAPPAANGVAASRATIDKETGRLRAPEADEPSPAAAARAGAATSRSAAPQSVLRSPNALRFQQQQIFGKDGAETMRLDLQKSLRFTVARRDIDGRVQKDCVVGEDAVAQRLSATTSATKEARDE